ncbi:MAG: hypothetical protein JSS43_26290 [Proteobacteria bacterium]|nr:hypothetical protein [Pseudomonadota bacterium]
MIWLFDAIRNLDELLCAPAGHPSPVPLQKPAQQTVCKLRHRQQPQAS